METIYATTRNFIRHEGNVVDLAEYRRKLAQAHGEEEYSAVPVVSALEKRVHRWYAPGMALDYAASLALIVTTIAFLVKIL